MTEKHLSNQTFTDLPLRPELFKGLQEAGFSRCTPIQAATLPIALAGNDLTGQAQTGTGKTAAFLLAMLNRLMETTPPEDRKRNQPRALILAPTRELAIQIYNDAEVLGRHANQKMVLVYGGTGYEQQRQDLGRGVDVLIGTPGRVIDYFKQGVFDLTKIEVAVMDEADRMFDLGFIRDIKFLFNRMPAPDQRLNMLFSATLSQRVHELAYEHMNEPEIVRIESETITADQVKQIVYHPSNDEKIPLLLGVLKALDDSRVLVFINTKHMAEKISLWLEANAIECAVLSGDVPQKKRERLLDEFKRGKLSVLVATDVAARGLHIPDVSHVINYDLPQDAEDYVHRIGRTARAGASGDAISFACEQYAFSLPEIEKFIGNDIAVQAIDSDLLFVDAIKPDMGKLTYSKTTRGGSARAGGRPVQRSGSSGGRPSGNRSNGGRTNSGDGRHRRGEDSRAREESRPRRIKERRKTTVLSGITEYKQPEGGLDPDMDTRTNRRLNETRMVVRRKVPELPAIG